MKGHRRKTKFNLIDVLSLILACLIIAQVVSAGVAFHVKFDPLSRIDTSIASFNRVVYLLQGNSGNLSDALTPNQVVARYQAAEQDPCALTIHSILTSLVATPRIVPGSIASEASGYF